jgi:serine/threonine protein kinase
MSSPKTSARAAPGKVTADAGHELRNYRLQGRIGQEDLATVYNAAHLTLDRPVVVHLLRRPDWVSVSRFQLAARLAARLSHPNLLPVIDAGHDDRYGYYLVTPALEARSLSEVLQSGPLDPVLALSVTKQIGAALDYLHSKGVIHRDVQPGNILLTKEGLAYLTNLSLAASPDTPDLSSVDEADYLTPYSAPEQRLDPSEAEPALDIYGLGAVLWHMLSGSAPPPPGESLPSLGSRDPLLNGAERVVQRMMAPQAGARYSSLAQAAAALRQALRVQLDRASEDMEESRWEASAEWLENPLETVLGEVLDQEFIKSSRERANKLHEVGVIRRLLDRWSRLSWARRTALGQIIEPEQITSFNIYSYDLRTVYETRSQPEARTRPQRPDERSAIAAVPDVWEVDVPDEQAGGRAQELTLPNSLRVITCSECGGQSKIVCKTCNGKGSIERSHKVKNPDGSTQTEMIAENCATCRGYGKQTCPQCLGAGNMVEEQVFTFAQRTRLWQNTDDLEGLPQLALERRAQQVYSAKIDPFEGRWHGVAPLAELLQAAVKEADTHTRIHSAELTIRGTTLTELDFTLNEKPHRLTIVGLDNEIVGDWALLNPERIALVALAAVLAVVLAGALLLTFF